jgi:hypothetical protein
MFAIFQNIESFNIWHDQIKVKLNYPLYGTNLATGEIDLVNVTSEYTEPKINSKDPRVIAWVGDEIEELELISETDSEWSSWFDSQTLGI